MNTYALDATPLNDNAVLGALGASVIALSAIGTVGLARQAVGTATISLPATAAGTIGKRIAGDGAIQILASAQGFNALRSSGDALIAFDGSGDTLTGKLAEGAAVIAMDGAYRVPQRLPAPATFYPAHISRIMEQGPDSRWVEVQPENAAGSRTVRCIPEPRRIAVPADPILTVRELRAATIQPEDRSA